VNDGSIYATCADVQVSSDIVAPPPPQVPNSPATSAVKTSASVKTSAAVRTSSAIKQTSEANNESAQPAGSVDSVGDCGESSTCIAACGGAANVESCKCENGQFLIQCTSSSHLVAPLLSVLICVIMSLL